MNLPDNSDIRAELLRRGEDATSQLDAMRAQVIAEHTPKQRAASAILFHFMSKHRYVAGGLAACWALILFFSLASPPRDVPVTIVAIAERGDLPVNYQDAFAAYQELIAIIQDELRRAGTTSAPASPPPKNPSPKIPKAT